MKNSKLADIIFFFSVFDKYLPAYVASSFPLPLVCHTFSRAALKTFLFVTSFQQLDCDAPFRFLPVSCARFLVNYLNLWFYIFKMKFDSCRHFFKYVSSDSSLPWGHSTYAVGCSEFSLSSLTLCPLFIFLSFVSFHMVAVVLS